MKKQDQDNQIAIYQTSSGAIELRQDMDADTIWAKQSDIASIFDVQQPVISKHIKNILEDKELDINSVYSKMEYTAEDGKKYKVNFYNLDVILAVGYRVNSKKAIAFRKWATQTLKNYITKGFTINPARIKLNYQEFSDAINDVKSLLSKDTVLDNYSVLELISLFADTWFSLDAYDKDKLEMQGITKKSVALTAGKLNQALVKLKQVVIEKQEATDIFAKEREKGAYR